MTGNPKESKWATTSQTDRKRKMVAITLSDRARARLERLAKKADLSKSELVETLIMDAKL